MVKTQLIKRVNVSKPGFLGNTISKQSTSFIEDIKNNSEFLSHTFVRLSSIDAFRLYQHNEWVYATVNRKVEDCVKIQPRVVPTDPTIEIREATKRRIKTIKRFLERPNDNKETFTNLRKKFIRDLQIFGHGAFEKVVDDTLVTQNDTRQLLEIHNLQASHLNVNADKFGNLPERNTYILREGNFSTNHTNDPIIYDKDEVIFVVLNPMVGSLYGTKPLDTLANAIASDLLRASYNSNFFVNGSEASGIITLDGASPKEMKKFQESWRCKHGGVRQAHRIAVVNKAVNYVRMALTNQDMQFQEYGDEIRKKIFSVFNMQPAILGIDDQAGGQIKNKTEAMECYKEGAIKPILCLEADAYTREIVQDGFGYDDIRISFDEIDALDKRAQAEIDNLDLASGVIVINEVRAKRGMQPKPWGDTPVTTMPGGGQIDPDTGRLIPPREQGGNNAQIRQTPNRGNSNRSRSFHDFRSVAYKSINRDVETLTNIDQYFNFVKNYVKILINNNVSIDKNNITSTFDACGEIYYKTLFNGIHERSICAYLIKHTKNILYYNNIKNYKTFLMLYDTVISSIKDSHIYRDLK